MKKLNKGTKAYKLFRTLLNGERLSAAAITKRFHIGNPRAELTRIRQAGFAVYRKSRMAANHVRVTEYVIGTPSQEIVAAGYRAIQLGLA